MTTTTDDLVRDRIVAVIAALAPTSPTSPGFAAYRNEDDGDFVKWAEANPDAAWRRFQVRDNGDDAPPEVSSVTLQESTRTFRILVAYSRTHRAGPKNALDRDRLMSRDQHQIEFAVGMTGKSNFSATNGFPEASWRSGRTARQSGTAVDFLVITQTMAFWRSMP